MQTTTSLEKMCWSAVYTRETKLLLIVAAYTSRPECPCRHVNNNYIYLWLVNFHFDPGSGKVTVASDALIPIQNHRWWKKFVGDWQWEKQRLKMCIFHLCFWICLWNKRDIEVISVKWPSYSNRLMKIMWEIKYKYLRECVSEIIWNS